ncbi:MAG: GGDEF domain-containing protein [Oscillospiraceae bacterium]|nr:GGDEF domain-containing protein [Oscillospiraceae bacterium]
MEKTILIVASSIAYLLFITKCFDLIEGMLYGKHFGLLFRLFIGIINAGMMVFMAMYVPINFVYLITLGILFAELLIFFRKSMKDSLFVSVAIMMNIMCLRGMVISVFALAIDGTLYMVCSNPYHLLGVLFVSNILEWLALFVILKFVSMEDLRYAMNNKTQSLYIIIWASLCILSLFRNSSVYVRDYSIPNMFIDHLSYCFMLLLSFYFMLVYTFKLNKAGKIREDNKYLSQALGNQIVLQSALTRDAIYTSKANLTKNEVISGSEIYNDPLVALHNEYDAWFEYAKSRILPEEYDYFCKTLERQNLLNDFNRGVEPKPMEYRHLTKDNNYRWVRLVLRMFRDVETDDVYLFGYAFDIDREVRNKEALMLEAQTDLFTGLYNKTTTEKLIGEELKNGAGLLFLLDIDDFKSVNDRFGHEAGDCVIKYFSDLLLNIFRKGDIVGRVGGDEFMIYVKDTAAISIAVDKANEILARLKTGVDYENIRIIISTSIGIAVIDEESYSFSDIYNQADCALYEAKFNGKNNYVIFKNNDKCSAR